jgi:hypothetical protein
MPKLIFPFISDKLKNSALSDRTQKLKEREQE